MTKKIQESPESLPRVNEQAAYVDKQGVRYNYIDVNDKFTFGFHVGLGFCAAVFMCAMVLGFIYLLIYFGRLGM